MRKKTRMQTPTGWESFIITENIKCRKTSFFSKFSFLSPVSDGLTQSESELLTEIREKMVRPPAGGTPLNLSGPVHTGQVGG